MSSSAAKERGNKFFRDGNYAAAIDEYSTAIDLASSNDLDLHITYSNRCACYMKLNKFSCALEDAQACISLKPTWAKGYSRLGSCLLKLGKGGEAVRQFERALELDPDNADIKDNLSIAKSAASGRGSCSSSSSGNANTGSYNRTSSHNGTNSASNSNNNNDFGSNILENIRGYAVQIMARATAWWNSLEENTRNMIMIGCALYVAYLLFFSGPSRPSYYDDYYSGYSYGGGMSWTMWISIMLAAWKLPPMFPDVLGEYAQPFFGMSWTTFMWLLNMFSRNRGVYGGGFGRGMGGVYNRRRY